MKNVGVRRLAAIPLLVCFLALGSGAMEYVHGLQHAREDAALAQTPARGPIHDDFNCRIHAQLHMPMVSAGWVPLLVCLGVFVAFLTLLTPVLAAQRTATAFDCRGPPSC